MYAYPASDAAIQYLTAKLTSIDKNTMPAGVQKWGQPGPPTTGNELNQTETCAEKRIKIMDRLKAQITEKKLAKSAIEAALGQMSEEHRKLVKVCYFDNFKVKNPGQLVWKYLGISQAVFRKRKQEALEVVARWLGERVE